MGAGSSAAQAAGAGEEISETAAVSEVAEPGTPPELLVLLEDEDQGAGDAKLLHKNGQLSAVNGTGEDQVKLSYWAEDKNGEEAEAGTDVGQREATAVSQKEEPAESLETMPQEEPAIVGIEQKDSQEVIEEIPVMEEKVEQVEQTTDAQSNEVGFKKVFKFVGFKFTVKKDKTEKTEPVQLLTVKKEDIEANGTDKQETKSETTEVKAETLEQSKPESLEIENHNENVFSIEEAVEETLAEKDSVGSAPEKTEESAGQVENKGEVEEEKEPKVSPESPVNPLVQETSSPFKKFFTQSWAGLRKRTSFKKPKEDEQQVVEKTATEQQEMDKSEIPVEASDKLKPGKDQEPVTEETTEPTSVTSPDDKPEIPLLEEPAEAICAPVAEISKDVQSEESTVSIVEKGEKSPEEEKPPVERQVPLADIAEVFVEENLELEAITPTSEEANEEAAKADVVVAENAKAGMAEVIVLTVASSCEQSSDVKEIQAVKPTDEPSDAKEALEAAVDVQEHRVEPCPPDASAPMPPEGITNEAELLSSQEKAKLQGSPLRKLFTGSSLKKLSGKKHKTKKEAESKPEERESKLEGTSEQLQSSSESPEAPEAEKEDSIPSSPEEPVDASSVEKPTTEAMQTSEGEGEGATSDSERKKDGITPWASFKKLVTPKKRVKKLSESDKEDEPEKAAKSATMSSTDSANSENQEESKAHEEEPKLEKSTEETKRKVDSSVSWEALICVGSSKKRGRKTSDSDEEEIPKPLEENPKTEEQEATGKSAETETEAPLASSQESDQAPGSPSPEQAGSPSEGEGVSTWASFKRLVTPRRKSKTRMEEKAEESATVLNIEHPPSEGEPGKEESWVSFKKLIPGRKKKKSDGKQEHALVEEGQETVEDEDDVPAVVPLSEYEAAEQEKLEAQQAIETETVRKDIVPLASCAEDDLEQAQEPSEGLVHAVTVTVVEGERAITSMEERSPSWISATVTESIQKEDACQQVQQTEQVFETDVVVEQAVVVKSLEFVNSEASDHTTANELELTSEAVTALEEAIEVSCAEETTEMVSAVSQLGESHGTSEESTPVPEAENSEQNLEELKKQTQEVLEEVAEKVRLSEAAKTITTTTVIEVTFSSSKANEVEKDMGEVIVSKQELFLNEALLSKSEPEEGEVQQVDHIEGVREVEAIIEEVSEVRIETCFVEKEHMQEVQMYVVDHEDSKEDEGYIEERSGESVDVTEREESDETVLKSSMPVNAVVEPEVKIEEIIIVQQQYQHFALRQDKLPDQYEATNISSGCVPAAEDSENVDVVHKEMEPEVEKGTESLNGLESSFDNTTKEDTVIAQEIVHVVLSDNSEMPEEETGQPIQADAEKVTDAHQELFVEKTAVEKDQLESGKTEFDDQGAHLNAVQEEVLDVHEEVIIANIQEVEASEARTVSVPITAAAVEEQVVTETVTLMDTSGETQEPVHPILAEHFANVCPDASVTELESEEHIIESAAQTAAAIMHAAFEAAKGSIDDGILDALPQGDAEARPQHVEKEDVSPELSETEREGKKDEYTAPVTVGSEVFTAEQELTQAAVKDWERFEEAAVDHFTSKVDAGADGELQVEGNDLQSDAKPAEELTDEKREDIGHLNVVEIIGTEVHALEAAGDHTEVAIAVSEASKGVSLDCPVQEVTEQVEADLEKQESVPQSLEPESLQMLPSANKMNDPSTITQHSEQVDVGSTEPQSSDSLKEITENNVDQAEETELHEAEVLGSLLTPKPSPQELNLLPADIEGGGVDCTVSIESCSSTIVEKIIQTACEEVERVEEEVAHEPAPEGLHEAESNQRPEDISVIEVAAKEENVQHKIIQASEASRTVFIESLSSTTIVETIVLTTVTEVEEKVCEPTSEVLGEIETNASPEGSHTFEVQEISEPPAMEPSPVQTTIEGEVSHTAGIDSPSSATVEKIVVTPVGGVEKVAEEVVLDAVPENVSEADALQEIEGADQPTTVAAPFNVLLPLKADSSPEDASAVRVAAETEEQVPCQLEICQATTEVSVWDFPDKQEADQPPIEAQTTEEPWLGQSAKETVPESQTPTRPEEDVLSEAGVTLGCTEPVLEHPTAVMTEQECPHSVKEKASQPVAAQDKGDVPVMEPDDAKADVALQGVDQLPAPVESESHTPQASVTATIATEALSKECHEAAGQLKETETEQTVDVLDEQVVHSVQEVVPSQTEDGVQSKAPEEAHRPEDAQQEQSHTKSMSEES